MESDGQGKTQTEKVADVMRANEALQAELERREAREAELNRELAAAKARLQAQDRDLEASAETMTTLNEELEVQHAELEAQYAELAGRNQELAALADALARRNQELERAIEERRQAQVTLQVVLEQMPAGVIVASAPWGRLLLASKQAEEIWRHPFVPTAKVADNETHRGFHADGRPLEPGEWPLARAISSGEVVQGEEIDFERGDGTRGTMTMSAAPVRDAAGRITAGVAIFEDITGRIATEERLRRAEERYRAFVAQSSEGIWRMELEAPLPVSLDEELQLAWLYEHGYVAECNAAMAHMLSYRQPEHVVGRRLGQVLPRLSSANVALLTTFVRGGYRAADVESREVDGQGGVRFFLNSLTGVVDDGHVVRIWGVKRDLTERKAIEEELRQARDDLAALLSMSAQLASGLEIEPLLDRALDQLKELVGYSTLTVFHLADPSQVEIVAYRGPLDRDTVIGHRLALKSMPGLAEVLRRRTAAVVADLEDPAARAWRAGRLVAQRVLLAGSRSMLAVPMTAQDRVVGVLRLSHKGKGFYSDRKARLAEAFASQLALAMESDRLYRQAREVAAVEERQRLARELHDAVSQTLFSASLIADVLPRIWERNPDQVWPLLHELRDLNRGARAEMRTLLWELRPQQLLEVSLDTLLRQLAEAVMGRARIKVSVSAEDSCPPLPADVQVGMYRIAQEALNNVVKHAAASAVGVELCWNRREGTWAVEVRLTISDDGRGFDVETVPGDRLGLSIMRERAQKIGARLRIESAPGEGTVLDVLWPE